MFVDELEIYAKAGDGGDGVVRWLRLKYQPKAGPAGGNGGRGGNVYLRGVRDLSLLSKYTGAKDFVAQNGESGHSESRAGKGSNDLYIDVPVGSLVTNLDTERTFEVTDTEEDILILRGGQGGLGNEYFKSSTNQTPQESTPGKPGEEGRFKIELQLTADVGLVGLPNAGKSTLLNNLTNARSAIGSYPFTTLEPHLGDFYGYVIADIPGLIEGASDGKGLGHKFLRHVKKTKMLLHLVSLENEDPIGDMHAIAQELANYNKDLSHKITWLVFTKTDLASAEKIDEIKKKIDKIENRVFFISENDPESIKSLADELSKELQKGG